MILMWLSTHPFYSKTPRHIISGVGYNMSSLRTTRPAECQPHASKLVLGAIKSSLERTTLHVELCWAKDRGLLCLQRASKDMQGKAHKLEQQMCKVREVLTFYAQGIPSIQALVLGFFLQTTSI